MEDIINDEARKVNAAADANAEGKVENELDDKLVNDSSNANPSLVNDDPDKVTGNVSKGQSDDKHSDKDKDADVDTDVDADDDKEDEESSENEDSIIKDLISRSGYEITDDEGNPLEFEDSEEGILQFSNKLAEIKAKEQVESFINKNQEVLDFYNYLQSGGKKEDYFKSDTSFLDIEIQREDVSTQEKIVTKDLKEKGFSDARIQAMIKSLKDNDSLFQEAVLSKKDLVTNYKQQQDKIKQETQRNLEQKREQIAKHWDNVNEVVSKGEFNNGFVVPEREREKFFNYISKPVNDENMSASMAAYRELPLEEKLTIDYLVMKATEQKLSIVDYISQRQETRKAKSLKDRLSKRSGTSTGKNGRGTVSSSNNNADTKSSNIEDFGVGDLIMK